MSITDYDSLISAVDDWLDRNDLASKVPQFIQMAEAHFNSELRAPEMESTATTTASEENTALPEDYLAMRSIYVDASPDRPLRAMAPTALRHEFSGESGIPVAYSIVAGQVRLAPPPSEDTTLIMDYFAEIPPLTSGNTTNWLLAKYPHLYLYQTLFHAEAWCDNATRAGQWKAMADEIMARINRAGRLDRWGSSPLVPNTATQVYGARC